MRITGFIVLVLLSALVSAQEFTGYVKKSDSIGSPIFQANIVVIEGSDTVKNLKSYFDGSYRFTPEKNKTYNIKVSFTGFKDTAFTITTDKNSKPTPASVSVRLRKDGMRLTGVIRSRDEHFPINEATIVVKNVMTRQEDRITTGIDGRYNFKLEYETNYKVWIDKRSTGIFNRYEDTSFYVSTIGFNIPLDYKLDIDLGPMLYPSTTPREGYDASKPSKNENIKPVIGIPEAKPGPPMQDTKQPFIAEKKDIKQVQDSLTKLKQELEKAQKKLDELKRKDEKEKQNKDLGSPAVNYVDKKVKKDKKKKELDVVIIRDSEPSESNSNSAVANDTKPDIDSLEALKRVNDSLDFTHKEKPKKDSLSKVHLEDSLKNHSTKDEASSKVKSSANDAPTTPTVKEKAIPKNEKKESSAKDTKTNSRSSVQSSATSKTKIDSSSVTREVESKKPVQGSLPDPTKTFYLTKSQEELIAAAEAFAKRKKFVQDSIAKIKELQKTDLNNPK